MIYSYRKVSALSSPKRETFSLPSHQHSKMTMSVIFGKVPRLHKERLSPHLSALHFTETDQKQGLAVGAVGAEETLKHCELVILLRQKVG